MEAVMTPPPPGVAAYHNAALCRELKRFSNFLDGDFDPEDLPLYPQVKRKGW
jgi:hypothetical protein